MINAAIVGTGNISSAHIEGLMEFPERCKIVALCDIYPEKAEAVKKKYGLDCPVFPDHKSMLAAGIKIDLVHVCTPPYVHCQISLTAWTQGAMCLLKSPWQLVLQSAIKCLKRKKEIR